MKITDYHFDGDFITKCTLDGTEVEFLNPDWSGKDFVDFAGRTAGGAAILNAFLPGAGLVVGGLVGAFSFLKGKGEGYYDHTGTKRHSGRLYRSALTWN